MLTFVLELGSLDRAPVEALIGEIYSAENVLLILFLLRFALHHNWERNLENLVPKFPPKPPLS